MSGPGYRTIYISDSSTGVDDTTGAIPGIVANKTLTVPTDRYWRILSLRATLTAAGAVGNRRVALTIDRNSSGTADTEPYVDVRAGVDQAASTARFYIFAPNIDRIAAFADTDWLTNPIPDVELPPNTVIRVFDQANIGTTDAFDDLDIRALIEERGGKG